MTLSERVIALLISFLIVIIILPVSVRRTGGERSNPSNLRRIGSGLRIYAIDNKEWYPVVNSDGEMPVDGPDGSSVTA